MSLSQVGLTNALMTIAGPAAFLGAALAAVVMTWRVGMDFPILTPMNFLWQFVALQVIGDLFLYLGHRLQHESQLLYKYHAVHHTLDTV